jgi:hypothetical protein
VLHRCEASNREEVAFVIDCKRGRLASVSLLLATTGGLIGLVLSAEAALAQADTVILRNGNPVIGEVKSLKRGSLEFDTDEMSLVSIDWEDIALLSSAEFFEVILSSGQKFFGSLQSADTAVLVIVGAARADTVPFEDVVLIGPIEQGFFHRTNGFLDLGTNLTRANRLKSLLVTGRANYRGPKWGLELTAEAYWQQQESVGEAGDTTTQQTSRSATSFGASRFIAGRWAAAATGQFEQNDELNLELRVLGVLGGTYHVIRNQGLEFYTGAGGTLNDEQFVGEERNRTGEILVVVGFDAFDVGAVDFYTNITTYTTPTDGGRFRANIDARIAWEIFSDFTVGLNVVERFDSKPPSADAQKRDYQYAFSVGWSWS